MKKIATSKDLFEYLNREESQLKRFGNFVYDHCDDKCNFGNRDIDHGLDGVMRSYGFSPYEFPCQLFNEVLFLIQENKRLKDSLSKIEHEATH